MSLADMATKALGEAGGIDAVKKALGEAGGIAASPGSVAGITGTAPAKSDTAKTKTSNEYMCDGFQQMFKEHQKTYGEVVFNSLGKYFQDAPSKAKLTAMLEQNIGQYIQSPQFRGTTAAVIKEAIGSVMRESLKTELKNPANFTGMCGEIQKLAMQHRVVRGGTRTKRKPKKKTIKRRN